MKHFRQWGAIYLLLVMFLGSWAGQAVAQAVEPGPFGWAVFWNATFENWQSEFLQLAVQALLVAGPLQYVLFRAEQSADKKDVERILRAIEDSR
jgi:hypothetical protein